MERRKLKTAVPGSPATAESPEERARVKRWLRGAMLRLGHDRAAANRLARELTPQALLIERGTMRAGEEVDIVATVCAWEEPSADALVVIQSRSGSTGLTLRSNTDPLG